MSSVPYRLSFFFLLILFMGVAAGCSSSAPPQVLAPEYERGTSRGVTIALLPLSSELLPAAADTTEPDGEALQTAYFTDRGHQLFYRLFGLELQEVAAASVIETGSDFRPINTTFRRHTLPVPAGDSLHLPVPDGPVQLTNSAADFVLLIDKLTFTPRSETIRAGDYGAPVQQENFYITATCQYMLWDNERARVAAYGTFERENRLVDPNSRAPYEQLFAQLAVHIIETSPIALNARAQPTAVAP